MESQLMFLNLEDATAEERELLERLQLVALSGHCKVTLPTEEPVTPASDRRSPEPQHPAGPPASGHESPPPAAREEEKLLYETCRQPPDGIEFAGDESAVAAATPAPPPLISQTQGLLGDMPAMGAAGMLPPTMQPVPMQAMLHGAPQPHHMYHHHPAPQHCPPGYPPIYNMMYPPGGYLPPPPPQFLHHDQPPLEPDARAAGPPGRRTNHKHNKPEKMYGAGGAYPMTPRTAAGPPLVMGPYPGHPASYHPHMLQMAYPYYHPYTGSVPPEMLMHPLQPAAAQQLDVGPLAPQSPAMPPPGVPEPAVQPLLPPQQVGPAVCDEFTGRAGGVTPEAEVQPAVMSSAAVADGVVVPPVAAPVPAGPVRLSFGFDLDDKLVGDASDSSAVQLDTLSPVPAQAPSTTTTPDCSTEADGRLQEGRPGAGAAGATASATEPGETACRLLGAPVPASYVATVTVSARVIDCDELKRSCTSPADSQDSGVAHTEVELCSPVNTESTVVAAEGSSVPEVVTSQVLSEGRATMSSPITAVSVAPAGHVSDVVAPMPMASAEVPAAALTAAPTAVSSHANASAVAEASSPEPAPASVEKPITEPAQASTPIPTPAPAPAPAAPWGGARSWASLFSKKAETGGPAPVPAPVPKQPPPPPAPVADSELLSLGAALAKFEPNYRNVSLQPRGLTNKSNWCYINAVLQALASCQPFYHLMKSLPSNIGLQSGQSRTPIIDAMVEFINELTPLQEVPRVTRRERERGRLRDLSLGAPFEPGYVYSMLAKVSNDAFKVDGRQEDAEEFLTCLLSGLQDEMADVLKVYEKNVEGDKAINGSTNGKEDSLSEDDSDDWQTIIGKNKGQVTRSAELQTTPVSRIFSGQLRSALHRQGSKATATVQSFFSLQLDIQSASVTSVDEALEQLVNRDAVHGLTCPATGRPVEAWQQAALEVVPPTLILHLKRFLFDPDGVQKLMKRVTYNVDLELKRDLLSTARSKLGPGQKKYRLFAVIYHSGKESTKGHYITDAYHPAYQQWVRYDDSSVAAVPEAAVLRPEPPLMPYILFYRRLEPHGSAHHGPSASHSHPHAAHNGE